MKNGMIYEELGNDDSKNKEGPFQVLDLPSVFGSPKNGYTCCLMWLL